MSNLFKSKFLLGVMVVAVMFVGAFAVNTEKASAASCSTFTMTLRYGMRNSQVLCLQQMLNQKGYHVDGVGAGSAGLETNFFGPATRTTVKSFQTANGLTSDGIFGPMSRASLVAQGNVSGNFPAGCASASGYSATTGLACYAIPPVQTGLPAGCTTTAGFSPTTGVACSTTPSVTYPAGCSSAAGFSSTTGASCATGVVTNTGPITVALATDNPASGSFIAPASGVEFAKFTFSGTGTVTSVKLQRTGVSSSATVSNVYLYDGATRLTDGASIGSDNTVTFNAPAGLFTVAGSKTITVVATTVTADYSLGFTLIGYTANTVASVVSVAGNQMFGASATLSTLAMAAATGSGDTDAGVDITVWQSTATNSTRDVILKSLALRNVGSIATADINNFKLYVDGVLVSTVANLDSNGYVTFAPNKVLTTGARVLKVTADVLGGSSRTVSMSLRGAYDIIATDTQYNANGVATGTFPNTATAFTVNSGSLTVVKAAASRSTNVTVGASDQSLATYTFTAYGEPVKIETLKVGMITTVGTNTTIRNVRILVNGLQVGSTTGVPAATTYAADAGTSFSTNFIVTPGTPATVEVRGDLVDSNTTSGDDISDNTETAIQVVLTAVTSLNGTRQVSLGTINVPSAAKTGNNLTISSGSISLALTSSYANRLTAIPTTAYKIGSFQLSGNATEAINLNTIYVGWTTASTILEAAELSDLYVVYGGTTSPVKGTVIASATPGAASLNSNSWSINKVLGVNETMQIDVYATIAGTLTGTGVINPTLAVAGTTASSGIPVYADITAQTPPTLEAGVTGQTVTGSTGTLVLSKDASLSAVSQIVDDSAVVKTLTAKFVALTDSYTVTDMTVTVTDVSAVSTVSLKYHAAYNGHAAGELIGAAKSAATSLSWSGLNLQVLAGDTMNVDVELALAPVGVNGGTTGGIITTAITAYTARNTAGTNGVGTSGNAAGNAIYVYKAIPTLALVSTPTGAGTLTPGTVTLSKFSVNTNGTGTIAWNRIIFLIAKTDAPILTFTSATTLYNVDSGAAVAGTVTVIDSAGVASCLNTKLLCEVSFIPSAEQQVTGSVNYALKAALTGTLVTTDYVTTRIANAGAALGYVAPVAYLTAGLAPATGTGSVDSHANALVAPTFVWSDVSASGHATTTADWSNDFLVRALPLDSQTLHY